MVPGGEWILEKWKQQLRIHHEDSPCSQTPYRWVLWPVTLHQRVPPEHIHDLSVLQTFPSPPEGLVPVLPPTTAKLKLVTVQAPSETYQRPAVQGPVTFLSAKVFCPKAFRHCFSLNELDVT